MSKLTWAAAGIVLLANAFALMHAYENRSGPMDADLVLTDRELASTFNYLDEDNSGVALTLRWSEVQYSLIGRIRSQVWFNEATLREVGFDLSVAPSDPKASDFYARQRARRAFVAIEYNGPAWEQYRVALETEMEREPQQKSALESQLALASHLVMIDASKDAAPLRGRHPDRSSVIIVPAVVRLSSGFNTKSHPEYGFRGFVLEAPTSIHVPKPFSETFRQMQQTVRRNGDETPLYRVHVRYGSSQEPWVTGVELIAAPTVEK